MFFHRQKQTPSNTKSDPAQSSESSSDPGALYRDIAALAIKELENPVVIKEHNRLLPEEQPIFMMTYGSFLIWGLSAGLRDLLPTKEVRQAIRAIREQLATYPWFDTEIFSAILHQMLIVMPLELTPGRYSGLVSPASDMLMAAKIAGYAVDTEYDPEFGYHVAYTLGRFARRAKSIVTEAKRVPGTRREEESSE